MIIDNNSEEIKEDVPKTSDEDPKKVIDTSVNDDEGQKEPEDNQSQDGKDTQVVENNDEEIEKRANELFEQKVEARLARDRSVRERETSKKFAKYQQLENIIESGLGVDNIDDAISKTSDFYKEQGITIPEYKERNLNARDEKILAEADAQEVINLGREETENEANRIASIPANERTERENIVFNKLCQELINWQDIDELKAKGYKTDILSTKEFKSFRNQFNSNTPITTIYDMYNKMNTTTSVADEPKPQSPGSAKTTQTNNEVKDYYTPEEARKFTEEDLDNPKLMKALEHSMTLWGKSK